MLRKNLLAVALGFASGSIALTASANGLTQGIGIDDDPLMYADELLMDQDSVGPWMISDSNGDSQFAVTDELGSGTVGQEPLYMRFDLINAEFKEPRGDGDFEIPDDEDINLIFGGGVGDDVAVYGITESGDGFEATDDFTFYLDGDDPEDGGLRWLDKSQPIVVQLCRYDENQDAVNPGADEEAAIDCRVWTVAEAKTGLSFECISYRNPVADVYARKGNYMDFQGWDWSYHDKGHSGAKNFGKCTLASGEDILNPDGREAVVDDYLDSDTQITISDGELDGWADEHDAYLSYSKRCQSEDADLRFPIPSDDQLLVDADELDLDQRMVMFNVCIDDRWRKHDPIPIVENYTAMVIDNGLTAGPYDRDIAGIDRNGIVLRAPFVTVHENAIQRAVLTNRGKIDAVYAFTCTSDDVENSEVMYLDSAQGVLKAGETACLEMKPRAGQPGVVDFTDGYKGACVITVEGRESHIDGAMTLYTGGRNDSTNMTPDEGYVETDPDLLPLDRDES